MVVFMMISMVYKIVYATACVQLQVLTAMVNDLVFITSFMNEFERRNKLYARAATFGLC